MTNYNATAFRVVNGEVESVFVVGVNADGKIVRSNWIQCTGYEETSQFEEYLLSRCKGQTIVLYPGTEAYIKAATRRQFPQEVLAKAKMLKENNNAYQSGCLYHC